MNCNAGKHENEKTLEQKLREGVKRLGGRAIKNGAAGITGMPDRTIYLPGNVTYLAELKSTGQTPNPRQRVVIEEFKALGYTTFVIDTTEKLNAALLVMSQNIFL